MPKPVPHGEINFDGVTCQETTGMIGQIYLRCERPATVIVWHNKDGKAYPMCPMCGDHNIRNRGGIQLVAKGKQ